MKMNEQVLEDYPALGKIYTIVFKNVRDIYEDAIGLIQVLRSVNTERALRDELASKDNEIEELNEKMIQVSAPPELLCRPSKPQRKSRRSAKATETIAKNFTKKLKTFDMNVMDSRTKSTGSLTSLNNSSSRIYSRRRRTIRLRTKLTNSKSKSVC